MSIALQSYNAQVDNFQKENAARETCIGRVESRQNNIDNWHANFENQRLLADAVGSVALREYVDRSQAEFDSKEQNQPLSVEVDCADFPVPSPVIIPPILIEEGIIDPNAD